MKDKVLIFIIGFLVGAVIASGVFYIYATSNSNNNNNTQMNGGTPPEMPQMSSGGTPPEMPNNN